MTDFSIEYILNRAGEKYMGTNASMDVLGRIQMRLSEQNVEKANRELRVNLELHQEPQVHQDFSTERSIFEQFPMFDWLQYTRYHPPKVQRTFRTGPIKRTPGRLPRIPFTSVQLESLEKAYQSSNYLSAADATKLAQSLDLTNTRVKIWFQNRRARERRDKKEKEESCDSTISSNTSSPEPVVIV